MNIEIGIGIGKGNVVSQLPFDRLLAYGWATALSPGVSSSSVLNAVINTVIASNNASVLSPIISNVQNASILANGANVNSSAFFPSISSIRHASINGLIANSSANILPPNVSNAQPVSLLAVVSNVSADAFIPTVSVIRNPSINAVITNSTTSAGVPTITIGSGGATYLQMDGVDDYIQTPSLTFTRLTLIMQVNLKTNVQQTFQGASAYSTLVFRRDNTNVDNFGSLWNNGVTVNGSSVTNNTAFIPSNQKITVDLKSTFTLTSVVNLFASSSATGNIAGNIYDIKFYNGQTLVVWYDMTTGTVQDQSGNGNHATLMNGGTWVVA